MNSKTMDHFVGLKPYSQSSRNRSSFRVRAQQAQKVAHAAELFISICFVLLTVGFAAYLTEHLMLFLQDHIAAHSRMPFIIPR